MLKDVSFGQYYPVKSIVHSMDPRVKLLISIAYIVFLFLVKNFIGFIPLLIFICLSVSLSKVPLKSVLRSIKGVLFLVIFAAVLNVFLYGAENADIITVNGIQLKWWIFSITTQGLYNAAFMTIRLIMLVFSTCILTLTTTPMDLTAAIESLLKPLTYIKFPVHELALIMSIALRFIPTLMEETDRIVNAQKSRGADFESGNVFSRMKAMVPILIPLLISAFRRAEELGDAMDSRCYSGSSGRTRYKKMTLSLKDLFATVVSVILFASVILLWYAPWAI